MNKGMNKEMSKEDWIILRLVFEAVRANWWCAPDHLKAINHLNKTYGRKVLNDCIDQLKEEKRK